MREPVRVDVVYILDTNTLGDFWRYGEATVLGRRLAAVPDQRTNLRITAITFEEMLGGRIKDLQRNPRNYPRLQPLHVRYQFLLETVNRLSDYYPPFPFDGPAQTIYETIPKAVRDGRVLDCRIASIAVQRGCTVITANVKDFSRIQKVIPVKFVDWTSETI